MESSVRSRRRVSRGMARGWNKVPGVLATAAVVLAIGLPGGPFGSEMAQAAVGESHLSIQPGLVVDGATMNQWPRELISSSLPSPTISKRGGGNNGGGGAENDNAAKVSNNGERQQRDRATKGTTTATTTRVV